MALTLRRVKGARLTKDELDDNFVHVNNYSNLTNKPELSNVATSGSYTDLSNTPNLDTKADVSYVSSALGSLASTLETKANAADLANVATSGSYNDLTNKPFVPADVSDLSDNNSLLNPPFIQDLKEIVSFDFGTVVNMNVRNRLEWILYLQDIDNGTIISPASVDHDAGTLI